MGRFPNRRLVQIERMFVIAELLRQFEFGCDQQWITQEINERMGESWSVRTIARDLQLFHLLGWVTKDIGTNRSGLGVRYLFTWRGVESFLSATTNRPTPLAKRRRPVTST